jgi:subtilisin-like proprotein convertase family protein
MSQIIANKATATLDVELATTFFGNGGNIPDGSSCFTDDIIVKDSFSITNVTVTLKDFVHTWVGDLVVRLRHLETGTVVELFRRPGQPQFSSSGYSNDLNGNYIFNDRSPKSFEVAAGEHSVIPSGKYAPSEALSAFSGLPVAGTWQLMINDCSAGDSGCLDSWSLSFGRG